MIRHLVLGVLLGVNVVTALPPSTVAAKGKPMVLISTSQGDIKLELYPDKAPETVKNFLAYVEAGYYDNTIFHRVIPGFMIQGGGLTGDLKDKRDGQRAAIKNESSNGLKNDASTVAMARTSAPDSATSQFFINLKNNDFLNKDAAQDGVGYAVFGKVVDGLDVVKKIEQVRTATKGMHQNVPAEAITIKTAKVIAS
jgi:cyclophilin family peptidyl-prolyl cis-trans isomerase